ncbi:HIT family protein [Halalkalibacillus halophilus]|uniref:HIT family protein n=1 Tax=Halalkalibacillus halophilus TaxID=392827 RepID=UPI000423C7EA|nr:HIT domain-containing protein [Halalkalibacillus halophilus]
MKDCVLCDIELRNDQRVVLENKFCRFVQIPQGVLEGSGLIVPVHHGATPFELTKEEWIATYDLLQEVKKHLDQKHQPDGYNIGWNSGSVAGQHIGHAHLHVIPRFQDEPYAGRGIRYWFKQKENKRLS